MYHRQKRQVVQRTPSVHYYWQELSNETLFFVHRDLSGFILYLTCSETFQDFRNKEVIFSEFIYRYKSIFKKTYTDLPWSCQLQGVERFKKRLCWFCRFFSKNFRFLMIFMRRVKQKMHKFLKLKGHFKTWHGWPFVVAMTRLSLHSKVKKGL